MANRRRKIPNGTPKLSGRDAQLIREFLTKHRADFLSAYMVCRESANIAPGLTQYRAGMAFRKNQMAAIDYMLSHLEDRYEFLVLTEGYEQIPADT